MRKSLAAAIPLFSAVIAIAACGSKTPAPVNPPLMPPDAGVGPFDDAGALPPDAGPAEVGAEADSGASPVALGEAALDTAIDFAITSAAPKVAPKMEKEGQPGRATLTEGEHFSMMINFAPNRCYTIVGHSLPGSVEKLDMKLYGPPLFNVEAGKSGANDKNMPVIGKGTAALCPILPIPVPYKVDVVATKGAGRIGVHVFSRSK